MMMLPFYFVESRKVERYHRDIELVKGFLRAHVKSFLRFHVKMELSEEELHQSALLYFGIDPIALNQEIRLLQKRQISGGKSDE